MIRTRPDPVFRLTDEEADTVAQILGAPRIAERFTELTREVPGLEAGQVHIQPGGPFVDRPLGETQRSHPDRRVDRGDRARRRRARLAGPGRDTARRTMS